MVSDDPKMQEQMMALDGGTVSDVPLLPDDSGNAEFNSNSAAIEEVKKEIDMAYNVNDMSGIMKIYSEFQAQGNGILKKEKAVYLKQAISAYLDHVNGMTDISAQMKLYTFYKQLTEFIKPVYISFLQSKGYSKFKDYITDQRYVGDPTVYENDYQLILRALKKRVSA